jgi:CBS-domain-containing membrane protein
MRVERIPIRSTVAIGRGGAKERSLSVYCPFRHRSFALEHCRTCPRVVTWSEAPDESGAHIVCASEDEPRAIAIHVSEQRLTGKLETVAATTPIGVVMDTSNLCVTDDLALDELRELIGGQTGRALPVVNARGQLLGVVAPDQAATSSRGVDVVEILRRVAPRTVRDVMTAHVVAFPESGRVREALNAMLVERVRYLPVVSENGEVIGMVWDLDLLTWLARGREPEASP